VQVDGPLMSFLEAARIFGWTYVLMSIVIGIIGLGTLGFALYLSINGLIDKYQEKKRRPMATDISRDELMYRRLKRSVHMRISTIKQANR
jgi:hypothetical protein